MLVAFMYANLVVSMAQVDGAEYCNLTETVKQVHNLQYWEDIELCLAIHSMVINAHPKFTCFLLHEENRSAIG